MLPGVAEKAAELRGDVAGEEDCISSGEFRWWDEMVGKIAMVPNLFEPI